MGDASVWTLYLRLLDGEAAGATHEEIADQLLSEESEGNRSSPWEDVTKVSNRLREAKKLLRPEGYLHFLGLPAQ